VSQRAGKGWRGGFCARSVTFFPVFGDFPSKLINIEQIES
jgi:hypothetical protein